MEFRFATAPSPSSFLQVTARQRSTQQGIFTLHTLQDAIMQDALPAGVSQRLNCFEMIWVNSGSGLLRIDTEMHMLNDHFVYGLVPGQMRNCTFTGPVEGYYLSFSEDFLYKTATFAAGNCWMDPFLSGTSVVVADAAMQADSDSVFSKMWREYRQDHALRTEMLSGLLQLLMMYCARKLPVRPADSYLSKDAALARRFLTLVKTQFAGLKQVSDYAAQLYVTANYLNRTVKKVTGSTASAHIQQHIIMEAKRQAIHSDLSMKEIAYRLGFDDLAHFSKFFKNNSGMSFSHFKKTPLLPQ